MEKLEFYQNLELSEIDFLPAEIIELFKDYKILTLGHLLGATKGLLNTSVFQYTDQNEALLQKLNDFIPAEIIELYRTFSETHPTGLLKDKENENETNTLDK